jgi:hypothetical protein
MQARGLYQGKPFWAVWVPQCGMRACCEDDGKKQAKKGGSICFSFSCVP